MVNYEKLLQKPEFWSLNNKKMLIEPYKYGGASLRGQGLNQGVRAILHGNEWIIPAKLVHMIPKKLKNAIKELNKE